MTSKKKSGPKKAVSKKTGARESSGKQDKGNIAFRKNGSWIQDRTRKELSDKIKSYQQNAKKKNRSLAEGKVRQAVSKSVIDLLTAAIGSIPFGIFIVDARKKDFPVVYSNPQFSEMLGQTEGSVSGQGYFLLLSLCWSERIKNEIEKKMLKGESFYGEMLNLKKRGEKCWNSLRLTPVAGAKGELTHYVGMQVDISQTRERESKIEEQRKDLLHVTRVGKLAEFVSSLAHEISQPLTSILAYAQAAQRMLGDTAPEVKKILSYIIEDDQRAEKVVGRLRTLLKKNAPEKESLDINDIIEETIVIIATDASVRKVGLKLELGSDLPRVFADKVQMQQVLLNLISNSFDAMEASEDKREILISTFMEDPDNVVVEVKDSGCGVPDENLSKLFTHFFTSKVEGLGMGLSISRSIIELHGGKLEAKNNPGKGATFSFTVPVCPRGV